MRRIVGVIVLYYPDDKLENNIASYLSNLEILSV